MAHEYEKVMFGKASRALQERYGSRVQYESMVAEGDGPDCLGERETEFLAERDSIYLASVTADGWPYMQHRGGPKGFLRVLDGKTIAFADFSGNRQYITTGNLVTDDRVSLFAMDYAGQARMTIIGHARAVEPGADADLDRAVQMPGYVANVERVIVIAVAGFAWHCSKFITQRWTREEMAAAKLG